MSLRYDFDIVRKALDEQMPDAPPTSGPDGGQVIALFRDVKTSDALRGASPKIRKMFQDAGFGLAAHDSGIAPDVYPPADQPERERILSALFASIKSQGVQGEYSGEFDFMQFLDHVQRARPVQGVVRSERVAQPLMPTPVSRSKRRAIPGRIGFALGLAVILFVLFKFLEAAGAGS